MCSPERTGWDSFGSHARKRATAVLEKPELRARELVLTEPALAPLQDLQQMRSLVLGVRTATKKLPGPILLGRYYAPPEVARPFYEAFVASLRQLLGRSGARVETGQFQAMMEVELVNDGPVTLLLDSEKLF